MTTETEERVESPIQRVFLEDNREEAHLIHCDFCSQSLQQTGQLFVGIHAASCPECMTLAHQVIADDLAKEGK